MNREQYKYYGFGYSGCNYLLVNRSVCTQSELLPDGEIREIQCDKDEKWMKVITKTQDSSEGTELDLNELQRGITIDLSEDGSRWEGDSVNGDPYGYGCIYNSENELIYSGFVYDGMKVCYGNVFYAFVGIIEYSGNFYNNLRCGYGKLYDKKNTLVYEGEWYNDNPIELSSLKIEEELKENVIHFGLEELEINIDCTCDSDYFSFFGLTNLKKITFYRCNYLFL